MLAQSWELLICVPSPVSLALVGPSTWPGIVTDAMLADGA